VLVDDWDPVLLVALELDALELDEPELVALELLVLVVVPCCVATRNPPANRTMTTTINRTPTIGFKCLQPSKPRLVYNPRVQNSDLRGFAELETR